jgi:hypothetical protein
MRPGARVLLILTLAASAGPAMSALPALGSPTGSSGPAVTAAAASPLFTPPLGLPGGGAEPSIRGPGAGSKQGVAAFVSAPSGLGSNFWTIREVKHPNGSISLVNSPVQQPDLGTGGGDSEISIGTGADPKTGCPTLAYSGLHNIDLLDNFTTSYSTDCGKTFAAPNLYATQNTLTDRQWQTFDGPKTNFLIFHKVDTSQIVVSRSLDGGKTYRSLSPTGSGLEGGGIIDQTTFPKVANQNKVGNIVTDYSRPTGGKYPNGTPIHTLWATFAGPQSVADNAAAQQQDGYDHNDTIYIAKSVDGGVNWVDYVAFGVDPKSKRELDTVFPVVAVDSGGGVYAMWSDQFKVEYTASRDGVHWSGKAVQVNPDNRGTTIQNGHADIFPWLRGGGPGKVDMVWYHGVGGTTTQYRNPGDANTKWTVAYTQLFNALPTSTGALAPTVKSLDLNASSGVIHTGSICNNGTLCDAVGGDRTLLDFFNVDNDPQGRAVIAYAVDQGHPGSAVTTFVRKNGGYNVNNGKVIPRQTVVPLFVPTGTSCPGPQVLDPSGDAKGTVLFNATGGNIPSFDFTNVRFTTPNTTTFDVTMTLKNLDPSPQPGTASKDWETYWTFGGKTYYAMAISNGPDAPGGTAQFFDQGFVEPTTGKKVSTGTPTGAFKSGPDGTITIHVIRALAGKPANGAKLTGPFAEDHAGYLAAGTGVYFTAVPDRAPDTKNGATYTVGGPC